jgi:cytochrome P450
MTTQALPDPTLLSDAEFFANGDPHALWRELRRQSGVLRADAPDGGGLWSVVRYADVRQVLRDGVAFVSSQGTVMVRGRSDAGNGQMLALTDQPRHSRLRAQLNPHFAPKLVAGLTASVRAAYERRFAVLPYGEPFDFVARFAGGGPFDVLAALLALPADEEAFFVETVRALSARDAGEQALARLELLDWFVRAVHARRDRGAGDDLVRVAGALSVGGVRVTPEEAALHCYNIMNAGLATAKNVLSGTMLVLAQRPELLAGLRDGALGVDELTEELLRWVSPVTVLMRTAARDVRIGSTAIARGDRVAVWIASANRDEAEFEVADTVVPTRWPNTHIAFGVGRHFCIGTSFARLHVRTFLQCAADRWARVELTGAPTWEASTIAYALDTLPVRVVSR